MAGIYIHIPFCRRKCLYCDFVSYADPDGIPAYLDALQKETVLAGKLRSLPKRFDTVFFGGGTPSLLTGSQIRSVLTLLFDTFPIDPDAEITMEYNPGTGSADLLASLYESGVNRLSIGLQSCNDALLKGIGRIHTLADFERTFRDARKAGFTNINADVMHRLPMQTEEDYLDTLRYLIELGIPHVSSYALILEEGTPLWNLVESGRRRLPDPDAAADMEDAGIALLKSAGYIRYEISNFCLPGHACRHNLNYWRNGPYLGLGVAAHGCLGSGTERLRYSNNTSLARYAAALVNGRLPVQEERLIPRREQMFETVMLGLRMAEGINRKDFLSRFGASVDAAYPIPIETLYAYGWIREDADSLALNDRGLDMNNAAIRLFMDP